MGKLILLSNGLNTTVGFNLVRKQLKNEDLRNKTIYLFYEPYFSIEEILVTACEKLGFMKENIILSSELGSEKKLREADFIYITEGNTFAILKILRERKIIDSMRDAVYSGATYIGASAGAMIAGKDIVCAADFDQNDVGLKDLNGLGLIDGAIIPHYSKKQLKEYKKNSNPENVKKHQKIYSIKEGGVLVY